MGWILRIRSLMLLLPVAQWCCEVVLQNNKYLPRYLCVMWFQFSHGSTLSAPFPPPPPFTYFDWIFQHSEFYLFSFSHLAFIWNGYCYESLQQITVNLFCDFSKYALLVSPFNSLNRLQRADLPTLLRMHVAQNSNQNLNFHKLL